MPQVVSESIVQLFGARRQVEEGPLSVPLPILVENLGNRAAEWAAGRTPTPTQAQRVPSQLT